MLSVKELRSMAKRLKRETFLRQLGPFALIQKPEDQGPSTDQFGLPANVAATRMADPETIAGNALALIFQLEELQVATLPPLSEDAELVVGRQPDCDLVVDERSVSKRHAVLQWEHASRTCRVQDLGSTNGTFLNASTRLKRAPLKLCDGDIVSFGDAQFWYLLSESLWERLSQAEQSDRLGGAG